jgi:hypothetical protein
MASLYRKESRSDPYDASMRNLAKACASARYHPPRPWRSAEERLMVRRFVFWWVTCRDRNKPSKRAWARQLGISHTWIGRLVREFKADPMKTWQLQAYGDPTPAQLSRAQEFTRQMRERGELRSSRRATDRDGL